MEPDPYPLNLKLDYEDLNESEICKIAHRLMNYAHLEIANEIYRFSDIELYLHNDTHPDPYVYCAPEQLLSHRFYFHKHKNGTYKETGSVKKMEITFGNEDFDTYFGILIRGIQNIKSGVRIKGRKMWLITS
jgi:hypothetical protein